MSADFWSMGGYAVFVWGSFGSAAVVFLWTLVMPRLERGDVLRRLRDANSTERDR